MLSRVLQIKSGALFEKELKAAGITVLKPNPFEAGNFKEPAMREYLGKLLKSSGYRIVSLVASSGDTKVVAESAAIEGIGMNAEGRAWITFEHRTAIRPLRGWICLTSHILSEGMQAFRKDVSDYTKSKFNVTLSPDSVDVTYSMALYNAVMLYAHAATKVLLNDITSML